MSWRAKTSALRGLSVSAGTHRLARTPFAEIRDRCYTFQGMTPHSSDSRIRMLTGGSLERIPFAEVVRSLYRERATAKLLVSRSGEERTFSFDRGQILFTSSNREAQLVGELLRTFGLADENLLLSAFEKALNEPGQGLARALTESGAVPGYVVECLLYTSDAADDLLCVDLGG